VLQKEDTDWVKKCMEYEVEGSTPRGRPKEDIERGCAKGLPSTQFEWRMLWIVVDGRS